jgi:hypothetical protein
VSVGPSAAVTLSPGDILVIDSLARFVIRVNPADGTQTVVSSGGNFGNPRGIAIAANGYLLVAVADCCGGGLTGGVIRVNPADGTQAVVSSEDNFAAPVGIAIVPGALPPGSCGGSVPCACGDRVVLDRTLDDGVDPVTTTVCPADGLIVADGVTLDLGGAILRGRGAGAGVRIETGATDVTIQRGKLSVLAAADGRPEWWSAGSEN